MRPELYVDRYRPEDRPALYEVCVRTAELGEDATDRYADPHLVGHIAMAPYVELEPELAFVLRPGPRVEGADAAPRPVGYVVGTADTLAFEAACEERWWPALRKRYPAEADYPDADAHHVRTIHGRSRPERPWLPAYPAHLHIDLLPVARGGGHGRALLTRFFEELTARGVPGVHLGVDARNTNAVGFYRHLGMQALRQDGHGLVMGKVTAPSPG